MNRSMNRQGRTSGDRSSGSASEAAAWPVSRGSSRGSGVAAQAAARPCRWSGLRTARLRAGPSREFTRAPSRGVAAEAAARPCRWSGLRTARLRAGPSREFTRDPPEESRLKPRLGPAAEAACAPPVYGQGRAEPRVHSRPYRWVAAQAAARPCRWSGVSLLTGPSREFIRGYRFAPWLRRSPASPGAPPPAPTCSSSSAPSSGSPAPGWVVGTAGRCVMVACSRRSTTSARWSNGTTASRHSSCRSSSSR